MSSYTPNQIKKLFDVRKTRRIKCRHFNGTKPKGRKMILTTNSVKEKFFPTLDDKNDRTGIFRRHLFENVITDIRSTQHQYAQPSGEGASSKNVVEKDAESIGAKHQLLY